MIKDLNSDKKNEVRFLKTVLTSIVSLLKQDIIEQQNIKNLNQNVNQYIKELEKVLNKISYQSIQTVNDINNQMINKTSEFRCTYSINNSSLIRNNMIETLCKYISEKQFELDSLIN